MACMAAPYRRGPLVALVIKLVTAPNTALIP
ncbi:protein of unknown function [Paraburkholderia kururiensis]